MNRGILRLWITCSTAWLGFVGWTVYAAARFDSALQSTCFEQAKAKDSGVNPFNCFDGTVPDLPALLNAAKDHVFTAILPIAAAFLLLLVIRWVVAGFRPSGAATNSNFQ